MKTCLKCHTEKELDAFSVNKHQKDGRHCYCRACLKKQYAANRERTPEQRMEKSLAAKERHRESPHIEMWYGARKRAKEKGLPFSITMEDIRIPVRCPVFGVEMAPGDGKAGRWSPSLDAIVPEKGYVLGNIQVISRFANTMKNSASPNELAIFSEWVLAPRLEACEQQVADLLTRIVLLESRLYMDNRTVPYESVFEKWPSQR